MFFCCCRDSAITPSVRTSASKTRSIFTRGGKEIFATAPLWTEKISRFGLGVSGTGRASSPGKKKGSAGDFSERRGQFFRLTDENRNVFAPEARSRRKENPLKSSQSLLKKGGSRPRARAGTPTSSPVNVRSRMKCGTKITPCGETPLGAASAQEHALEKRNCPAGTPRRENAERFGRLRLSGAVDAPTFPQARASRRAWGYACFAPSGRILKFPSADFEGKRDA